MHVLLSKLQFFCWHYNDLTVSFCQEPLKKKECEVMCCIAALPLHSWTTWKITHPFFYGLLIIVLINAWLCLCISVACSRLCNDDLIRYLTTQSTHPGDWWPQPVVSECSFSQFLTYQIKEIKEMRNFFCLLACISGWLCLVIHSLPVDYFL